MRRTVHSDLMRESEKEEKVNSGSHVKRFKGGRKILPSLDGLKEAKTQIPAPTNVPLLGAGYERQPVHNDGWESV